MTSSRVVRGRDTERLMAEYLRGVHYSGAASQAASMKGDDVLNVGRLAIEVKATATNPILPALRQVHARAGQAQIPVGIWRPAGYGAAKIEEWVVFTRVGTFFGPIAELSNWYE